MKTHPWHYLLPSLLLGVSALACGGSDTPATPTMAAIMTPTTIPASTSTPSLGLVPTGLNTGAIAPTGVIGQWGQYITLALDETGNPFIAYAHLDLNSDGDPVDSKIYWVHWEADTGRWTEPKLIADSTGLAVYLNSDQMALAYDTNTSTFGLLYTDSGRVLQLALSADKGQTWNTTPVTVEGDYHIFGGPNLVMANGQIHLAVADDRAADGQYVLYATRTVTDPTWSTQAAPTLAGLTMRWAQPALALDSAGQPALAYWQKPAEGDNWTVAFWRPGTTEAIAALDSANTLNENPFVTLSFMGQKAVVVALVRRGASSETEVIGTMWATTSSDEQNWSSPVRVPDESMEYMERAGLVASPQRVVLIGHAYANFDTICSSLRTATSTNGQDWSVCQPQLDAEKRYITTNFEHGVLGPDGKLNIAFLALEGETSKIVFWREP